MVDILLLFVSWFSSTWCLLSFWHSRSGVDLFLFCLNIPIFMYWFYQVVVL